MNRTPKPCTCARVRHRHGTKACYTRCGCRCYPCNNAYLAGERNRAVGIIEPRQCNYVDGLGTNRRIEALHAVGWSAPQIGRRLGVTGEHIHRLRVRAQVAPSTAAAIDALYRELWDKQPPRTTKGERVSYAKTTRAAQDRGYQPPLAWDDIDTDPTPPVPDADPAVDEVLVDRLCGGLQRLPRGSRAPERTEAIRRLARLGLTDAEIARRVGITQWNTQKIRERCGIEPAKSNGRAAA